MALRVYYDLMSQPSRAIYLFLKVANIPFESCLVKLREGRITNTQSTLKSVL